MVTSPHFHTSKMWEEVLGRCGEVCWGVGGEERCGRVSGEVCWGVEKVRKNVGVWERVWGEWGSVLGVEKVRKNVECGASSYTPTHFPVTYPLIFPHIPLHPSTLSHTSLHTSLHLPHTFSYISACSQHTSLQLSPHLPLYLLKV